MIDDIKRIHQRDKEDALGAIACQWEQLQAEILCSPALNVERVANVVYAGMGGSAMGALLASAIPVCRVPFEIVRNYGIPPYVGPQTLFIACSSSGNTEETIGAIALASARGAQIAVITAGGKLAQTARERGYPLVLVPKLRHSRFTVFYVLKALVALLESAKVSLVTQAEIAKVADFLHEETVAWLSTVPVKLNIAKQIAQECMGRSVVVYAGPTLGPAAYRWKMALNENAKQLAWWGILPEFNHNEFASWSGQPEQKPYAVIDLRSNLDNPRVQKRFEITERLLSGLRPSPIIVRAKGVNALEQLLWSATLGDFVGTYLGLLNGYDPTSLAIVDKLKRTMGDYTAPTA